MNKLILDNLYFEDYFVTLNKVERELFKSVARIFWYFIFAIGLVFIITGLNYSLVVKPIFVSLIIGKSFAFSLFWLGLFLLLYFFHHLLKSRKPKFNLHEINFEEELKTKKINLSDFIEPLTKDFLTGVLDSSKRHFYNIDRIIFRLILKQDFSKSLFGHLEANIEKIKDKFETYKNDFESYSNDDSMELDFTSLIKEAFLNALILDDDFIDFTHILLAVFKRHAKLFKEIFLGDNIEFEDVKNALFLDKLKKKYYYLIYRAKPRKIKHKYMDLAMTAKPTYFLDTFSYDLTDLVRYGLVGFMIGHNEEIDELVNILNLDAKNNALLVGQSGIGKTTIIESLAWRVFRGQVPRKLQDKRVVALDTGGILGGLRSPGELQERLGKIRDEILSAKNLILVIPDIHDLIKATSMQAASLGSFFGPIFQSTDFPIISSTDEKNYHLYVEPDPEIANAFSEIKIKEITRDEGIQLLMIEGFKIEAKKGVLVSYYAIKEAVDVAVKYIRNQSLPSKAVALLYDSVENVLSQGKRAINKEDIREAFSKRTGIPLAQTKSEEKKILLDLENILHQRMIDQEEAVKAIAEALREARTGLAREGGPIGVFLFVGPTGVGKTEMAKTLANYYFHGENLMLRFDMSEYQSLDAIYRLTGYKGQGGTMTEAVKQHPFSLVLLDEFEKANKDVLNLFLQVFDDGRLTDELGNVVDFTNTIIIATSNAHSVLIKEELERGKGVDEIKDLLKQRLTDYFRPELINRFDEIVVFKPLNKRDIRQIALLQIGRLFWQIENERGLKFKITEPALNQIAQIGFDPVYGGRPLRQAIRKKIKNLISLLILQDKLERAKHYILNYSEALDFFIVEESKNLVLKIDNLQEKSTI